MDEKIDKLYTFDNQSKEDALDLLKGDCEVRNKTHKVDCTCTWCQQDCKEKMMKLLTPELPQKEGKIDPEVYVFADQTKEKVKELIEKANKPRLAKSHKSTINGPVFPADSYSSDESADQAFIEMIHSQEMAEKSVRLVGDNEKAPCAEDICPDIRKAGTNDDLSDEAFEKIYLENARVLVGIDESEDICKLGSLWRKLSGVRPKERVYEDNTISNLLDKIIRALEKVLPEMDFAWSEDYNQVLLVNKAHTRFSTDSLIVVYEAVNNLAGKEEAEEVVVSIIKKKVCDLFI